MINMEFKNAYYIKLGRNGCWEESSIQENKIRIGWPNQTLEDINNGNWQKIKRNLQGTSKNKGVGTRDYNDLKIICESTDDDIWITFYASKLWWCRVGKARIYEDNTSKYRKIKKQWYDHSINGHPLLINEISGKIAKIQGYRGTRCTVKETEDLKRLLSDTPSREYDSIVDAKELLSNKIEFGMKRLHWKDFETLIDLIFRNTGWRRLSLIGDKMKYVDIELQEPITGDLYQVQIKSSATSSDFEEYAKRFSNKNYRKFYFVVHSPHGVWPKNIKEKYKNVELILPNRLADMVIELGLIDWLMNKIK